MPKGVEHKDVWVNGNRVGTVIYPLMPKGVEHIWTKDIGAETVLK